MNPPASANLPAATPQSGSDHVFAGAVRGVVWAAISFAGSKLLVFLSTLILARLLLPADFGQVAFALLVISYLDTVGDLGVGEALIYQQKESAAAANISFVIGLLTGLLWFGLIQLLAPIAADFLHDPAVTGILRAMGWVFPITALGNTHDALLRREMAFKHRLIPEFARALLKGALSVVLALQGWGVWSLVWGQIIGAAAATIALWLVVPWRPGCSFSWRLARPMIAFGGQIVSVNIVAAVAHHADYLIVGRMLGTTALGFYGLAYRVPELFITMIVWVVGKVAFPAYAKLQNDPPALQRAFLSTLRYLSLFTVPAGAGLAVLAPTIVATFYGENWKPSVPVLQALAIAGTLRSLGSHAGDVYKATGRPAILTKLGLLRAVVLVPSLIFAARFGIAGVAAAQMFVTGASTIFGLFVAGKILALPMRSILAEFRPALLGAVTMVVSVQLVHPALLHLPGAAALPLALSFGLAVYAVLMWQIRPDSIRGAVAMVVASLK